MIFYSCPKCGQKHSARDGNAGRRGFCKCGAIIIVPERSACGVGADDVGMPLKRWRDWHTYLVGGVFGAAVISAVVYFVVFYNAWERQHKDQLLTLVTEARASTAEGNLAESKAKYDAFVTLVGQHEFSDSTLRYLVKTANQERQEVVRRLGLFYDAERSPPFAVGGNGFNSRDDAIKALSAQFGETPDWVVGNMGQSNSLAEISAILQKLHDAKVQVAEHERITQAAALAPSRTTDRFYRDSAGQILSESETEARLSQLRIRINSMPDSAERAFQQGELKALENEWARIKRQGPIQQ